MPSLRDPQSRLSLVGAALSFPIASLQALWTMLLTRPQAILTAGGLVSLPVALAGAVYGVPLVLWDGDAVPGRVNRMLSRFARRVATTFPEEATYFPSTKVVLTGNPMHRDLLAWTPAAGRARLGLPESAAVVLVSGGSQGARPINDAVFGALPRLLARAFVVHLAGERHLADANARALSLPPELSLRYRPYGFVEEEMGAALAAADLVVGRAGSGTIYGALVVGRPLVLIPFEPAASGHQLANARSAVAAGAAALLRESELDPDRLAAVVLGLLNDPGRLTRMRQAARSAGKPDAAVTIAREVLALAQPRSGRKQQRPMAQPKR